MGHPVSGHVFRYEAERRATWCAKYRLPDGRQVKKTLGPAWTERGRPPGSGAPIIVIETKPTVDGAGVRAAFACWPAKTAKCTPGRYLRRIGTDAAAPV